MNVEFINEILFLLVNYHFILLTDVVSDSDTRNGIGYGLIASIGLILVMNFGVIIGVNVSTLLRTLKLKRLRANAIKQR